MIDFEKEIQNSSISFARPKILADRPQIFRIFASRKISQKFLRPKNRKNRRLMRYPQKIAQKFSSENFCSPTRKVRLSRTLRAGTNSRLPRAVKNFGKFFAKICRYPQKIKFSEATNYPLTRSTFWPLGQKVRLEELTPQKNDQNLTKQSFWAAIWLLPQS